VLNADVRLTIDGVPSAIVYADNVNRGRVYAFAAGPRIALDENGAPQLSLLLYSHGKDAPPEGGQLTLTTSMELTDGERAGIAAALASSPPSGPAPDRPAGSPGDPPTPAAAGKAPDIVAPDWLSGQVAVHLAEGVELAGQPSLSGANTCVLAASLDAGQAQTMVAAIRDGLPDSVATYSVDIAAVRSGAAAAERTQTGPGRTSSVRFEAAVTAGERLHFELRGPLPLALAHRGTVTAAFTL
jgi:hypothetical protein